MRNLSKPEINPFIVMEILEEAQKLEGSGKEIIHLEIGEPTQEVDEKIVKNGLKALKEKKYKYSSSLGIPELRKLISEDYKTNFNLNIEPERIILTSGSSAAILLAILSSTKINEEIIIIDPHYPCYPQIIKILGRGIKIFKTFETENYQIDVNMLKKIISNKTKSLIINSPANPTGVSQSDIILKKLSKLNIQIISDEIYQGLSIDYPLNTILKHDPTNSIVVNGFSKYYSMTGWRLGYLIMPKRLIRYAQKLQQNMFICAPTISQHAAIGCYKISKKNKDLLIKNYKKNRDFLIKELRRMNISVNYKPDSAFYIFCDMSNYTKNSLNLCKDILDKVGLALAPGIDFGKDYKKFIRISYASTFSDIKKGMILLDSYLKKYMK